uniref:Uncharacterized protein n=1 Tax=Lepeophtheirus salmonis TaxID=72036 RepID=A0A0K2UEM5_LEPSM
MFVLSGVNVGISELEVSKFILRVELRAGRITVSSSIVTSIRCRVVSRIWSSISDGFWFFSLVLSILDDRNIMIRCSVGCKVWCYVRSRCIS